MPSGGHAMATWRDLVPPMLEWMTPLLAHAAHHPPPVQQVRKSHQSGWDGHGQPAVHLATVRGL